MPVIRCPSCGDKFRVSDDLLGNVIRCRNCQGQIGVQEKTPMFQCHDCGEEFPWKAGREKEIASGRSEGAYAGLLTTGRQSATHYTLVKLCDDCFARRVKREQQETTQMVLVGFCIVLAIALGIFSGVGADSILVGFLVFLAGAIGVPLVIISVMQAKEKAAEHED